MGSIPPAASIEYPQREIVNLIADAGLIPDNADLHQLGRAIQTSNIIHAVDSGPVNTLIVNLAPAISSYQHGLTLWVTVHITNTGPSTINVNNVGVKNIVRRGGDPLGTGDMPGGYKSLLVYSLEHNNFELYGINFVSAGGGGTGFLPILIANTVLFVDTSIGSDTLYDGTTAAISGPHGPYKTIKRAMTETFKYGPSIYTMTINIAAGNYNENVETPAIVGPTTIINGAGKTATFINGDPVVAGYSIHPSNSNQMTVQNLCVKTIRADEGVSCCVSTTGATLIIKDIAVGGPGAATHGYLIDALGGTVVVYNVDINANTNCYAVFVSFTGGNLIFGNSIVNNLGPINCNVYATASANAVMSTAQPGSGADPTFYNAGFVTGYKFTIALNGVINTQGHSVNYFPGTIAGFASTGGQYG